MISNENFNQVKEAFTDKDVVIGFNKYTITGKVISVDRGGYNLIDATIKDNDAPDGTPILKTPIARVALTSIFIAVV